MALMSFLFEFFPVLVFVIAWGVYDLFVATAATIVCMVAQMIWLLARKKPISKIQIASLVLVLVLGGATLILQDGAFIKVKPTVLYWAVAIVFAGAALLSKKNLAKQLMGNAVDAENRLPESVWRGVNAVWIAFFAMLGALNLFVVSAFSEEVWVFFKFFGVMGLMFLFFLGQGIYLHKRLEKITP